MKTSYEKLCTEFYDRDKPRAGEREVGFYANILNQAEGPFLEAMCGSGRLLIPLLERGFQIDGVDSSAEMLKSCKERSQHLKVELFHQPLQELSIPKKYGVIFIPFGSFQLLEDRQQVLSSLKKLHAHLLPGGSLLLDTFIPCDAMKLLETAFPWKVIQGGLFHDEVVNLFEERIVFPEGYAIIYRGKRTANLNEQIEISEGVYEKTLHGKILATEKERLAVRWYYRQELACLLRECGFSQVQIRDESFELNPQVTIYRAKKM